MQVLSNQQMQEIAPSIFAQQPWQKMSDKYRFIPTINVIDAMRENGFQPVKAMQSRTRIEGKGDFTKHLIRFRHADYLQARTVGQEVPEIVLVNSHDGSSAYQLMAGIFRLVCSNGMVVCNADMGAISARHSGKNDLVHDVIEGSYKIIEDAPQQFAQIENFKAVQLSPDQQIAFAKAAVELKGENAAQTFDAARFLQARRLEDKGTDGRRDLWRTMNVVQENMIRGGIRGLSANRRRVTSRAVNSVSEDIRINKALWLLTTEMAKLAA